MAPGDVSRLTLAVQIANSPSWGKTRFSGWTEAHVVTSETIIAKDEVIIGTLRNEDKT